jgi:hypothetical protein
VKNSPFLRLVILLYCRSSDAYGCSSVKALAKFGLLSDRTLAYFIGGLLVYWGSLAVLLPVNNWDSHVYDLGRLAVAENAGFWQKTAWNSNRQIMFPWTFDAVHYPFVKIGWGYALPSFLSFLGVLAITYHLISVRWGKTTGLWAVLGLLSMPTIMLQATTTKNDLAIVFGVACWLYAWVRFQKSAHPFFLFAAALSLNFTLGSKTSALPIWAILTTLNICSLRKNSKALLTFLGFYAIFFALFGSLETYALSWSIFADPLGQPDFVLDHSNRDGLPGTIANFIRYYIGNFSLGIEGNPSPFGLSPVLQIACRQLLHSLHLDNVGYRSDFNDATLQFLKNGSDASSDFGLIGFIALVINSISIGKPNFRDPKWLLSFAGFVTLGLTSATIAWMPWSARFLCLSFALLTVAMVILVFGEGEKSSWMRQILGVLILLSALSLPFFCDGRKPADLAKSLSARDELTFMQRPDLQQVYDEVLAIRKHNPKRW